MARHNSSRMGGAHNFDMRNHAPLIARMDRLTESVRKKHAWAAGLQGANVLKNDAKARAKVIDARPRRPGEPDTKIWKKIAAVRNKQIARNSNGTIGYSVGVRGGARFRKGDKKLGLTTYWRYVEFGTEDTPAQPFLRPAAGKMGEAERRFAEVLNERINQELGGP